MSTEYGDSPEGEQARLQAYEDARVEQDKPCSPDRSVHWWDAAADAEGDTCNCGAWYRFNDRIEATPQHEAQSAPAGTDGRTE